MTGSDLRRAVTVKNPRSAGYIAARKGLSVDPVAVLKYE
jgi:hypothetical protein